MTKILGKFNSCSFKNNAKKENLISEKMDTLIPILLEENESNVVYNIMRQLLDSNKIKVNKFEELVDIAKNRIMFRNFGRAGVHLILKIQSNINVQKLQNFGKQKEKNYADDDDNFQVITIMKHYPQYAKRIRC